MKYHLFYSLSFSIILFSIFFIKNKLINNSKKFTYHDDNFNEINYNKLYYDSINNVYCNGFMSPTEYPKII